MNIEVVLSAHGNPDHGENPYSNVAHNAICYADSIEECQQIVSRYIEKNDLGSGNWTGGAVYKDGEQIGYISYNGRYWPKGSEYYKELADTLNELVHGKPVSIAETAVENDGLVEC